MFYATGSIYECDGKWCLPEGESATPVPNESSSAGQDGATTSSSNGNGDHTATPAVSVSGVNNASSDRATVVETASDGQPVESSPTAEGGNGNGARKDGWGMGLAMVAVGVAMGAGGLL